MPEKNSYTLEWSSIWPTTQTCLKQKLFEPYENFFYFQKIPHACLKKISCTLGWLLINRGIKEIFITKMTADLVYLENFSNLSEKFFLRSLEKNDFNQKKNFLY